MAVLILPVENCYGFAYGSLTATLKLLAVGTWNDQNYLFNDKIGQRDRNWHNGNDTCLSSKKPWWYGWPLWFNHIWAIDFKSSKLFEYVQKRYKLIKLVGLLTQITLISEFSRMSGSIMFGLLLFAWGVGHDTFPFWLLFFMWFLLKIEKWWRELHERMEKYFKEQLNWLKDQGHYNPHSERDRCE